MKLRQVKNQVLQLVGCQIFGCEGMDRKHKLLHYTSFLQQHSRITVFLLPVIGGDNLGMQAVLFGYLRAMSVHKLLELTVLMCSSITSLSVMNNNPPQYFLPCHHCVLECIHQLFSCGRLGHVYPQSCGRPGHVLSLGVWNTCLLIIHVGK